MKTMQLKTRLASEKGKFDCPSPQCTAKNRKRTYSRVLDIASEKLLPYEFGRCDKPSCGYQRIPTKQDLVNLGILGSSLIKDSTFSSSENTAAYCGANPQNPSYLEHSLAQIMHTLNPELLENNQLVRAIIQQSGCSLDKILSIFKKYGVGTVTKGEFKDAPIFYRYDQNKRIYPGQIITYANNGKRNKSANKRITNSGISLDKTCKISKPIYFGSHLIKAPFTKKIGLVESPKTALIAALYEPTFIWVATCGMSCFSPNENGKLRMQPLKPHPIVVFPDADAYKDHLSKDQKPRKGWLSYANEWKKMGYSISVSSTVLTHAKRTANPNNADLADILLLDPIA